MSSAIEKYKGDSNRETIELHLVSEPGKVPLTEKQQDLLDRWIFADELRRRNQLMRDGIARMIMRRFDVSRATAYQDIVQAEHVFASTAPLNKKYGIQRRIELLEMKINEMYEGIKFREDLEEEDAEAEDADFLVKLSRLKNNEHYYNAACAAERNLLGYYKLYPDIVPPRSPKTIIFNIQAEKLPASELSLKEAMKIDGIVEDIEIIPDDEPDETE